MGQIIVIEDNLIFADYVCRLLARTGYKSEITSSCNGARKTVYQDAGGQHRTCRHAFARR